MSNDTNTHFYICIETIAKVIVSLFVLCLSILLSYITENISLITTAMLFDMQCGYITEFHSFLVNNNYLLLLFTTALFLFLVCFILLIYDKDSRQIDDAVRKSLYPECKSSAEDNTTNDTGKYKCIIDGKLYEYAFIGECFCRPSMSSFNITNKDITEYNRYLFSYNAMRTKISKIRYFTSFLPCAVVYAFELAFVSNYFDCAIDDYNNGIIALAVVIPVLLSFFLRAVLSFGFWEKLILETQIINIEPAKPDKYNKIKEYLIKSDEFKNKEPEYRQKYPGIQYVNYDLKEFGIECMHSITKELVAFTEFQNKIILKENLKQTQKFWFELGPFEFEEEVADWYKRQGYIAKVTQKSGDNGVDIIISKGNYTAYVQCKRYRTSKVDRPTLNALYGVVCADKVTQGIVVCLLGVTDGAKEFADRVGIKIVTIEELSPKEDLFCHKVTNELLCIQPIKLNMSWMVIGNFELNTNAYSTESDVSKQIDKWGGSEYYRCLPYKGVFICLNCRLADFSAFAKWRDGTK